MLGRGGSTPDDPVNVLCVSARTLGRACQRVHDG